MKLIFTGIKPTGKIHIGNYFGFLKEILKLQEKYQVLLMIADLHAQTVFYKPKELKFFTYELTSSLLSLGVKPKKTIIFRQSDIPSHLYLYWILGSISYLGELYRMHEFKEQSEKYKKIGVGSGILMYPILQAADILIYNADLVPVGKDQVQHLELARELARRFNQRFRKFFKVPEIHLNPETEKIMSLDNPLKKMSKSLPEGCLEIFSQRKEIEEKIKKAVTDSGQEIKYDVENKPGISNLMIIYKYLTNKSLEEIEKEFKDSNYSYFKEKVIFAFFEYFDEPRKIKKQMTKNYIEKILNQGKMRANKIAQGNLEKILKITGLR